MGIRVMGRSLFRDMYGVWVFDKVGFWGFDKVGFGVCIDQIVEGQGI